MNENTTTEMSMDKERIAELRARFNRPCDVEDDDMIPEPIGRELLAALEAASAALAGVEAEREAVAACAKDFRDRYWALTESRDSYGFYQADGRLEKALSRLSPVPSRDAGGA